MKIRCLFATGNGTTTWFLVECMEHEAWACGQDFSDTHKDHYTDFRELTVELDGDEVQTVLGSVATLGASIVKETK
jgi:hypothetical protein